MKNALYGIRVNDSTLIAADREEAHAVISGVILGAQALPVNTSVMNAAREILAQVDALPDGQFLTHEVSPGVILRVTGENGEIPR